MIRINLLPFRAARKKENIRRQVSIFLLSFMLVVILLVWYNFSLVEKTERLSNKIDRTKKELDTYKEINKEIAEIKNRLKVLKAKTDVIQELESNRREPVLMLDRMTEVVVPKRMWFTEFKVTEKIAKIDKPKRRKAKRGKAKRGKPQKGLSEKPPSTTVVDVKGVALDNKTVADFMTRLEDSRMFVNVNLKTLEQVTIKDVTLKKFEVSFQKALAEKAGT